MKNTISSHSAQKPMSTAPADCGGSLQNPILQQIAGEIADGVSSPLKPAFDAILDAALHLAFDAKTHPMLVDSLNSTPDTSKNISLICTGMLVEIYSNNIAEADLFIPAAGPAGLALMCHLLQFTERSGMLESTPEVVSECATQTAISLMNKAGLAGVSLAHILSPGK